MALSLLPSVNSVLPATRNALVANSSKRELADMIDQLPEVSIQISLLTPGVQLRADGIDPAHVRVLADAAESVRLPAILVQRNSLRVIDGKHRVEVANLRGESVISARIVDCTDAEALVLAIKSNTLHGLPLSRADRNSGAERVLAAHPDWSDRAVACVTGLSAKSVASLRNSADDARFSGKRLGRDGKRHPVMPTEGRRRAAEFMLAHPEASLRQIAREADVSLGTAHVVREKIRCGGDSVSSASGRQAGPRGRASAQASEEAAVVPVSPIRPSAVAPGRGGRSRRWSAIAAKLASDPSLRYTEGGRTFLRWMTGHCLQEDEWEEFVDTIPQHWLPEIVKIAVSMSEEWGQFAQKLGTKLDEASA
jgi:ParB-like chromosome segregation protein Spo0J